MIFVVISAASNALGIAELPTGWRITAAAAGLLLLATADLRAISRSSYCPIGWRRQTPRVLVRRYHIVAVAALWGFDTGLLITTFRVAAVSWGALYLAALGLAPPWAGLAYGAGFIVPFIILLLRPALGRAARSEGPADPGFDRMLRLRSPVQGVSAALLILGGAGLVVKLLGPA